MGAIGEWCRENDVDAWFDQSGYMCVSTAPGFDDVSAAAVEAAAALGAPEAVTVLDEAAVQGPLRLPGLPRRRARARFRHPAPGAAGAGPAQRG